MSRRAVGMVVILVVAIVLGALRDWLFTNLNYQIDFLQNNRAFSYAHSRFQAFASAMDLGTLWTLKWALSSLYILVMLTLGIALSRMLFGDHRYALALVVGFGVVGVLALLFHGISSGADAWYNISVKLLHALQYPVVLIFIWGGAQLAAYRR